jgi:hypothetical protein
VSGGELDSGLDALNEAGLPRCPVVVPVGACNELGLKCWAESFSECSDCTYTCTGDGWQRECKRCGYGVTTVAVVALVTRARA